MLLVDREFKLVFHLFLQLKNRSKNTLIRKLLEPQLPVACCRRARITRAEHYTAQQHTQSSKPPTMYGYVREYCCVLARFIDCPPSVLMFFCANYTRAAHRNVA